MDAREEVVWGPENDAAGPLCLFTCGPKRFALPVAALGGVIETGDLVRMPLAPARVVGLCSHRRQALPVFQLEGSTPVCTASSAVLLVRSDQGTWGLRADREGVAVIESHVVPGSAEGPGACGTVLHEGRTYTVLDPELAWRDLRAEIEREYSKARPGADSSRSSNHRPTSSPQ